MPQGISPSRVVAGTTAYRDPEALLALARALARQEVVPAKLIIIDNSPAPLPDRVRAELASLSRLPVQIEHHPENLGIGGAMERVFSLALEGGAGFVWMFDQDSEPDPSALRRLLEVWGQLDDFGNPLGVLASLPVSFGCEAHGFDFVKGRFLSRTRGSQPYACDVVITAGALFSLERVAAIPVPVELFIDLVDYEFCLRIRDAGFRIMVVPESRVQHRMGEAREIRWAGLRLLLSGYSSLRWYYYSRNLTLVEFRRSRGREKVRTFLRRILFLKSPLKDALFSGPDLTRFWAGLKGTWDGLRGRHGKTWTASL